MKKILFIATSILTLAACTNDDSYDNQPVAAQISATISENSVSRASNDSWGEGDEIGISMTGNDVSYINMKYTTGKGDGDFSGTPMYFKNHIDPLTLTAYYPFTGVEGKVPDEDGIIETSTTFDLQTPEGQIYFDFLYARLDNVTGRTPEVKFMFSHRMSKLTFIFVNGDGSDVSKITSYSIEGMILDGTFNTATGVCAAKSDAEAKSLSISNVNVKNDEALPSLIVFPQGADSKTVKLKITDSEGQDYACELQFKDGIVSGNNYQWRIKVSKTGLIVDTSTISNWNKEELGSEANSDLS